MEKQKIKNNSAKGKVKLASCKLANLKLTTYIVVRH